MMDVVRSWRTYANMKGLAQGRSAWRGAVPFKPQNVVPQYQSKKKSIQHIVCRHVCKAREGNSQFSLQPIGLHHINIAEYLSCLVVFWLPKRRTVNATLIRPIAFAAVVHLVHTHTTVCAVSQRIMLFFSKTTLCQV